MEFDEAFWDDRYRERESVWSGLPNPHLVSEASALAPGSALDVGSGEGADAIWLARCGWDVVAVDFSSVALARAAARAVAEDVPSDRIAWTHQDLTEWEPPSSTFDLVSAQFMHLSEAQRHALFRRLAAAVAPGGMLLIVGHHPADLEQHPDRHSTAGRAPHADAYFRAEDVAGSLAPGEWTILVSGSRTRATGNDDDATVTDAVLSAVRSSSRRSSARSGRRP